MPKSEVSFEKSPIRDGFGVFQLPQKVGRAHVTKGVRYDPDGSKHVYPMDGGRLENKPGFLQRFINLLGWFYPIFMHLLYHYP